MEYLKCRYSRGALPDEYCVYLKSFPPQGLFFVRKKDVLTITEKDGLLRLVGLEEIRDGFRARFNDPGGYNLTTIIVPKSEIIKS